MSDFHGDPKECKSRKPKPCIWCGEAISKGEAQVVQRGCFDGRMYTNYYHPECWADPSLHEACEIDGEFTPL